MLAHLCLSNTCVIGHKRAAWALASAKALVSSNPHSLSFPQGASLKCGCVVSVVELSLTRVCFHTSPFETVWLRMSGPSSELKSMYLATFANLMASSVISCPTHIRMPFFRLLRVSVSKNLNMGKPLTIYE